MTDCGRRIVISRISEYLLRVCRDGKRNMPTEDFNLPDLEDDDTPRGQAMVVFNIANPPFARLINLDPDAIF
jgi:hypothetical protein